MLNEIFNIVAPIAKTLIEGYVCSAISDDYSPKKTDNPFSGQAIQKSIIKNYCTFSQMDPDREENKPGNPSMNIQYKGNISAPTIQQQTEETPYTLAMKKQYKYNF